MKESELWNGAYVLSLEGNYNAGSVKSERRDNNRGRRVVAPSVLSLDYFSVDMMMSGLVFE